MVSLNFIMLFLLLSGVAAIFSESVKAHSARWLALISVLFTSLYYVYALLGSASSGLLNEKTITIITRTSWISRFNIEYALGIDSLTVILIFLTLFLAFICILVSWQEIKYKAGLFYFNLLAAIAGIVGVFSAMDLFLFFFFWEVMLLPMTALIAIWGHENRRFAAIKFFIFTQVSSLLMLVAIVAFAIFYFQHTGGLSFYYIDWQQVELPLAMGKYLMLGFFIAFAVKLPSIPFHSWLPDAHTQAPTAGSVLLAGVLLKTGAYGLIRFVIQLFPQASENFASVAIILGVISILYGAKMAFAQRDIKRLIAYSSISHMGFVMLALFSFNVISFNGAVLTLVAHGLSSAALFSMAGMIVSRLNSRNLTAMGGLWLGAPIMGGFTLVFAASAFGLPGLANFIGEFFTLVGSFQVYPVATMFAALGLIGSAIYGIVLFQSSFHGKGQEVVADLSIRELIVTLSLFMALLVIGLYPNMVMSLIESYNLKGG